VRTGIGLTKSVRKAVAYSLEAEALARLAHITLGIHLKTNLVR